MREPGSATPLKSGGRYDGPFAVLFQPNCAVKELSFVSRSTKSGWWSSRLHGGVKYNSRTGRFTFETKSHGTFSVLARRVLKIVDGYGETVCELREE